MPWKNYSTVKLFARWFLLMVIGLSAYLFGCGVEKMQKPNEFVEGCVIAIMGLVFIVDFVRTMWIIESYKERE